MPKLSLRIFAHQVAQIMAQEADGKPTTYCPCDGVKMVIKITPLKNQPSYTDSCTINNDYAGNRFGAIKEFTELVLEENPELLKEEN